MKIYPVILAGGSGTRLWPLSRAAMPKQFLSLNSDMTLLQETVLRASSIGIASSPIIICGNEHRFLVAEQLREINIIPDQIILEPCARNTAPAITVAAHYIAQKDPNGVILIMPADHVIADNISFRSAVENGLIGVEAQGIVTFGIVPSKAATGYGYIKRGSAIQNTSVCFHVARFVEKPNITVAREFIASEHYYWNSGIFLSSASVILTEVDMHNRAIFDNASKAFDEARFDSDFCWLNEQSYSSCPSDSIDYAVMEHTSKAMVVPAEFTWSDIGSWAALKDIQAQDSHQNCVRGDVHVEDVHNSIIFAERRFVAAIGVENLVIVETSDAVLISHLDHVQNVKAIVEHLKKNKRAEIENHKIVHRPWGTYEGIDTGERFQVKRITVNPGAKLSLQMHHHRAEHWVVVSGTAKITCGDSIKLLSENESTYIPIGTVHRLENPGKLPLRMIEVQSGSYLGEDDIVRFEDDYQRK